MKIFFKSLGKQAIEFHKKTMINFIKKEKHEVINKKAAGIM